VNKKLDKDFFKLSDEGQKKLLSAFRDISTKIAEDPDYNLMVQRIVREIFGQDWGDKELEPLSWWEDISE